MVLNNCGGGGAVRSEDRTREAGQKCHTSICLHTKVHAAAVLGVLRMMRKKKKAAYA